MDRCARLHGLRRYVHKCCVLGDHFKRWSFFFFFFSWILFFQHFSLFAVCTTIVKSIEFIWVHTFSHKNNSHCYVSKLVLKQVTIRKKSLFWTVQYKKRCVTFESNHCKKKKKKSILIELDQRNTPIVARKNIILYQVIIFRQILPYKHVQN